MKLKSKMFELKIDDDSDIAYRLLYQNKIQNTHKYENNRNNNNDDKL